MLRCLATLILMFPLALGAGAAAEVKVVRVWPGYRKAESFERIAEFFGGAENPSHGAVLRSQPGARAGYYFLVRVANAGAARTGCIWQLRVVTPGSPQPRTFEFRGELAHGSHAYELGLTGADWPTPKAEPVAWRIELRAGDGSVLVTTQSFLWGGAPAPAAN